MGTVEDYFLAITGWDRFRGSQFGIKHYCTMGLSPKGPNNIELADSVIELLPRYQEKENCVASTRSDTMTYYEGNSVLRGQEPRVER